jgi:hypothetical protein
VVLTHQLAERMRANPQCQYVRATGGACLVGFGIKLVAMR